MPTQNEVIDAIRRVFDPEIPVNVFDLGLIYDVKVEGSKVEIQMTLTTQACPAAQSLPGQVQSMVASVPGVTEANVELVWDPHWTPEMISPEGRKILRIE